MLVDDDVSVKHTIWIILIRLRITTHAGSIPDQLRSSELIKIASLYIYLVGLLWARFHNLIIGIGLPLAFPAPVNTGKVRFLPIMAHSFLQ